MANIDFIDEQVINWTRTKSKKEIHQLLMDAHIPCAPIQTLKEVVRDPHYIARGMLTEIEHPQKGQMSVFGNPIRFSANHLVAPSPAPLLGQHNEEVYTKLLGLTKKQYEELLKEQVI